MLLNSLSGNFYPNWTICSVTCSQADILYWVTFKLAEIALSD